MSIALPFMGTCLWQSLKTLRKSLMWAQALEFGRLIVSALFDRLRPVPHNCTSRGWVSIRSGDRGWSLSHPTRLVSFAIIRSWVRYRKVSDVKICRVPPNVSFVIDDANSEWSFPVESFDFIHVRGLSGCIDHWPAFLRQCYRYDRYMSSSNSMQTN